MQNSRNYIKHLPRLEAAKWENRMDWIGITLQNCKRNGINLTKPMLLQ